MRLRTKLKLWNYRRKLNSDQKMVFDKKLVITQLRAEYAFWGIDTSNTTDEEIEAGVLRLAELLRSTGVSAKQACDSFRMMGETSQGMK